MKSIELSDGTFYYGLSKAQPPPSRRQAERIAWTVAVVAAIACFVFGFGGATVGLIIAMAIAAPSAIIGILLSEP